MLGGEPLHQHLGVDLYLRSYRDNLGVSTFSFRRTAGYFIVNLSDVSVNPFNCCILVRNASFVTKL